jgi:hypothetical protein
MHALVASSSGGMAIFWLLYLAVAVLVIAGFWKMFEKASKPGWAAIIPFYNEWVLCETAGRPGWWLVLLLIPFVQIVVWFIVWIDLAKRFGKGTGYGVAAAFFPFVFAPILGFGQAQYQS